MKKCICFLLLAAMALSLLAACAPADKPVPEQPTDPPASDVPDFRQVTFEDAYTELAVALFQQTAAVNQDKNMLISPLSIQLALAMTANGADGQTRQEMEALLGRGIDLDALNACLRAYVKKLPSGKAAKLSIANSIWFRDQKNLTVEQSFLQINKDYYDAEVFQRPFDNTTVKEINNWVDHSTDGMIDQILDAADRLAAKGISAGVVKLNRIAPLQAEDLLPVLGDIGTLLIAEASFGTGCVGQRISSILSEAAAGPRRLILKNLGKDFVPAGSVQQLLHSRGLDGEGIAASVLEEMK